MDARRSKESHPGHIGASSQNSISWPIPSPLPTLGEGSHPLRVVAMRYRGKLSSRAQR
jgi:hypothetical protein